MDRSETLRVLAEATRQAKVATSSAASTSGPQARGAVNAGAVINGVYVPYGRVGITAISDGFLPRQD